MHTDTHTYIIGGKWFRIPACQSSKKQPSITRWDSLALGPERANICQNIHFPISGTPNSNCVPKRLWLATDPEVSFSPPEYTGHFVIKVNKNAFVGLDFCAFQGISGYYLVSHSSVPRTTGNLVPLSTMHRRPGLKCHWGVPSMAHAAGRIEHFSAHWEPPRCGHGEAISGLSKARHFLPQLDGGFHRVLCFCSRSLCLAFVASQTKRFRQAAVHSVVVRHDRLALV